ncbi:MAG: helix-turn-helix domain-containing protein [Chitinophagales bacterium]|nr:helix-turn-helix domain-containing protein [Chitinophagales bacterium]
MPVQVVTTDDLVSFREELLHDLKEFLSAQPKHRKWLKSEDVREMLNISPGTLQTLRINRTLPFSKVGGTIFYEYDDVIKVLNENKRTAEK